MFKFFNSRKWFLWAWIGSFIILSSLWVQVVIDVKINEWFGVFYDMIQKALAEPNAVSIEEYFASLFSFITLAGMYIAVYVAISFFTAHYFIHVIITVPRVGIPQIRNEMPQIHEVTERPISRWFPYSTSVLHRARFWRCKRFTFHTFHIFCGQNRLSVFGLD